MRGVVLAALILVVGAGAAGVRHPAFRYERIVPAFRNEVRLEDYL